MPDNEKKTFDFIFLLRAIAAWLVCSAALLLCGTVLYASDVSALSTLGYASSLISFLAAFGAACAAALQQKEGRMKRGLFSAFFLTVLLLLTGFLINGSLEKSAVLSVVSFTTTGCMLGALLPARRKKNMRFRDKMQRGKK